MKPFEISSFRGGVSDFEDAGIEGAFKFGSGLDIRKRVDSLSCQQALASEGAGIIDDLIVVFVKSSDGNIYGFGDNGHVFKRTTLGVWSKVYTGISTCRGAAEGYSLSSGKKYMYFADTINLHRKEVPGASNWSDVDGGSWPKTNLDDVPFHTMLELGGDTLIANNGKLAFVGYDDSYTNNALDLIPGNVVSTLVDRQGRAIIGTVDKASLNDTSRLDGVNAAIDCEFPLAQIGNNGEVYFADMVNKVPYKRFPGGGKVFAGGVANQVDQAAFFEWEQDALHWIDKQNISNMSLWGVYGADAGKNGIYTIGRKDKNHPFVMNLEYALEMAYIGALVNENGVTLASYYDGVSAYGVKKVDSTAKAVGTYEGIDLHAPYRKDNAITRWVQAELFMAPLPTGATVQFQYRINKIGSFVVAKLADGSASFTTANGTKAVFRIGAEGEIFEPKIILTPNGNNSPEIYRVRISIE